MEIDNFIRGTSNARHGKHYLSEIGSNDKTQREQWLPDTVNQCLNTKSKNFCLLKHWHIRHWQLITGHIDDTKHGEFAERYRCTNKLNKGSVIHVVGMYWLPYRGHNSNLMQGLTHRYKDIIDYLTGFLSFLMLWTLTTWYKVRWSLDTRNIDFLLQD